LLREYTAQVSLSFHPLAENTLMLRSPRLLAIFTATLLAFPALAADKPLSQEDLDKTLRQLEKDIAKVRGLEFKSPVKAKIIPRPADADKKLQGYYSLKDKTLYVYDDLKGSYERGVLIHEMVHALQDQHFGLEKLHQSAFGSDSELALAALVEGDATWTMIELVQKEQPAVLKMLDAPLEKSRDLQRAFLYAQGARYVKALKEKGGWEAVNARYQFPPQTTAAILHPEGVSTFDLGLGKTRGEYALIAMLMENKDLAPEAVKTAAGWKADKFRADGANQWWVIAFDTAPQATRCQEALTKLHELQHPKDQRVLAERNITVWATDKDAQAGVLRSGTRVLVLSAPSETAFKALVERVTGPLSLDVYSTRDKKAIGFGEMVDRLMLADVICIGETHDSEPAHRAQLQIIKAIHARDERLGVGMEMFQRPYQKEIDRYFRGEIKEDEFLKATEYKTRWGYDWALYRPIVEFCRKNEVPLAALNVPRELTRRVSKVGYDKLTDDEKKQLGPIDFHVKAHRDYWFERLAAMHGSNDATKEEKERGYQVMTAWDEFMADSAATFQQQQGLRRLVVLAGSGHIERGFGIPERTVKRTGGKAATIGVEVGGDLKKLTAEPTTDFLIVVR
jgi:uncharacterized iron-regulated protein